MDAASEDALVPISTQSPVLTATVQTAEQTEKIKNEFPPPEQDLPKSLDGSTDKQTLLAVLQFLRKSNLKETESILRREANLLEGAKLETGSQSHTEVSNVLSAYTSEGDPDIYESAYSNLSKFVESSLDMYKHELATISYPVFVHMYLELVYNGHQAQAQSFMQKFGPLQEQYYQDDIQQLSAVIKREHMKGNQLMDNFKTSQFTVRMSRDTYTYLKRHLQEKKQNVLLNIIQDHLYIDVYEGVPRNKHQVESTEGSMVGEATRQANKAKVYFGLLKEPELPMPLEEEEEGAEEGGGEKPKKKKAKKDPLASKKPKNDPNAPPANKMPLPELKDADKHEKIMLLRESMKRVKLGPENLPSICFYTFLNCHQGITSVDIAEDSSLLAAGFQDSVIKVWSLLPTKLKGMKSAADLAQIDKEADDVLVRMMDDRSSSDYKTLLGHSGPVYSTSFNPNRTLMLSCSEDSTIRLWSLQTWTSLVCYRGHGFPVWDVKFSPHGYYFVSSGHDRIARLWATEYPLPLRLFTGHVSDVDCVQFHPNSHYVATGSSDRSVRLWDIQTGNCVRFLTGHKGPIYSLAFSVDGRFLASGGADKQVLVWDIAQGTLVAELKGHTDTVYSMAFSRDGGILASGGIDCCVKIWDMNKLTECTDMEDINITHNPHVLTNTENILAGSYPTKNTSVLALHFTRRNLLKSAGMYFG